MRRLAAVLVVAFMATGCRAAPKPQASRIVNVCGAGPIHWKWVQSN